MFDQEITTKEDLLQWVPVALNNLGGKGTVTEISKYIWEHHKEELYNSGDFFYTWQYALRWAGYILRNSGELKAVNGRKDLPWELSDMNPREKEEEIL